MRYTRMAAWALLGGSTILLAGCASYNRLVTARWRAWERGVVRNPDGVRTGCEPFCLGEGRTAILFVHGFGDNPSVWRPMAEKFAAQGFYCRAMRLPGFGGTMDERRQVNPGVWTKAIANEATRLRHRHEKVWIVAHSLGAAVSVRHVLQGGDEIAGLALLAPLVKVSDKRSPVLGARAWFNLLGRHMPLLESPFSEDCLKPMPTGRPAVERFIPMNVYHAMFKVMDENEGRPGDLHLPLYGVVTRRDSVSDPVAAGNWLNRTSGVPIRRVVQARNSAHLIPLDFDADWIGDEIVKFIRGC